MLTIFAIEVSLLHLSNIEQVVQNPQSTLLLILPVRIDAIKDVIWRHLLEKSGPTFDLMYLGQLGTVAIAVPFSELSHCWSQTQKVQTEIRPIWTVSAKIF